jgi:hypothetical protein
VSVEQFVAILAALAALFGAVAKCISEVRQYHRAVNSKMDALLELTAVSSHASGVLEGQQESVTHAGLPHSDYDPPSSHWRRGHN